MTTTESSCPLGVVYEHVSFTAFPVIALPSADSGVIVAAPSYCSSWEPR